MTRESRVIREVFGEEGQLLGGRPRLLSHGFRWGRLGDVAIVYSEQCQQRIVVALSESEGSDQICDYVKEKCQCMTRTHDQEVATCECDGVTVLN